MQKINHRFIFDSIYFMFGKTPLHYDLSLSHTSDAAEISRDKRNAIEEISLLQIK